MKKCPFCAEEIKQDAIKCRYCKEWLDKVEPVISELKKIEPEKIETIVAEVVEAPERVKKKVKKQPLLESKEDYNINAGLFSPEGFKDPTSLSKWLHILLFLGIAISVVAFCSSWLHLDLLSSIKKGLYPSIAEVESNDTRQRFIEILQRVLYLITGITFLVWIYRANYNARKLGAEGMKFTPGWSVGWYFVPIACFWKPYQAMKEIWKASKYPSSGLQSKPSDPILGWWWAFWIIDSSVNTMAFKISVRAEEINELYNASLIGLIVNIIDIPLYIIAIFLVGNIFEMQMDKKTALNEMKICPNCGTKNRKGDYICVGCRIAIGL